MKKKMLSAATAASLCVAAGGAFADQPVNKDGPEWKEQWSLQQYITICSNNGQGNNNETVAESVAVGVPPPPELSCKKFVPGDEDLGLTNNNTGEACVNTEDCDPKPE